jgi:hypothetical protein
MATEEERKRTEKKAKTLFSFVVLACEVDVVCRKVLLPSLAKQLLHLNIEASVATCATIFKLVLVSTLISFSRTSTTNNLKACNGLHPLMTVVEIMG